MLALRRPRFPILGEKAEMTSRLGISCTVSSVEQRRPAALRRREGRGVAAEVTIGTALMLRRIAMKACYGNITTTIVVPDGWKATHRIHRRFDSRSLADPLGKCMDEGRTSRFADEGCFPRIPRPRSFGELGESLTNLVLK